MLVMVVALGIIGLVRYNPTSTESSERDVQMSDYYHKYGGNHALQKWMKPLVCVAVAAISVALAFIFLYTPADTINHFEIPSQEHIIKITDNEANEA